MKEWPPDEELVQFWIDGYTVIAQSRHTGRLCGGYDDEELEDVLDWLDATEPQ